MIRETHVRDIEVINSYSAAVENEIDLPFGFVAWMGWSVRDVRIFQTCCRKEKFQLPAAPEGIEISGYNNFLICFFNEAVKKFKLVLSMSVFKGEVDNKDCNFL